MGVKVEVALASVEQKHKMKLNFPSFFETAMALVVMVEAVEVVAVEQRKASPNHYYLSPNYRQCFFEILLLEMTTAKAYCNLKNQTLLEMEMEMQMRFSLVMRKQKIVAERNKFLEMNQILHLVM